MNGTRIVDQVIHLGQLHRDAIAKTLRCRYPNLDHARIEDGIQDAFLQLLDGRARPSALLLDEAGGVDEARALAFLRLVALRSVRGTHRLKRNRAEVGMAALPERGVDADRAVIVLETRRVQAQILRLLPDAAQRFGGSQPAQLLAALQEVFVTFTGDNNAVLARRHGIRREYMSRATSWVRRALPAA